MSTEKPFSASLSEALINTRFPLFIDKEVRPKILAGAIEYGDESFSKDPILLLKELKKECADLAGWGWILYERLCKMERSILEYESTLKKE